MVVVGVVVVVVSVKVTFICGKAYASCIQQGSSNLNPSMFSSVRGYSESGDVPSGNTVLILAQSMSPLSDPLGPPNAVSN